MKRAIPLITLLVSTPILAQEGAEQPTDPKAAQRPVTWSVALSTELGFNASLDNSPGDVTVSRVGGELGVGIPIATMAQLDLGFKYSYSRYDFSNATGFVSGVSSPWRDIHEETVRVRFSQQHDARTAWFVGGSIGVSAEEGAETEDSLRGSILGGATYSVSESLTLGAALAVTTRIEDGAWVFLVPIVEWRIDPQWRLSNAGRPGLTMYYTPEEQWTLSIGAWFDSRDFRLDDAGPVPGGVGRDQSIPIAFGATFRPTQNMTLDMGAGLRAFQSFELLNATGGTVSEIDADPSLFLSFSVGVKF